MTPAMAVLLRAIELPGLDPGLRWEMLRELDLLESRSSPTTASATRSSIVSIPFR